MTGETNDGEKKRGNSAACWVLPRGFLDDSQIFALGGGYRQASIYYFLQRTSQRLSPWLASSAARAVRIQAYYSAVLCSPRNESVRYIRGSCFLFSFFFFFLRPNWLRTVLNNQLVIALCYSDFPLAAGTSVMKKNIRWRSITHAAGRSRDRGILKSTYRGLTGVLVLCKVDNVLVSG